MESESSHQPEQRSTNTSVATEPTSALSPRTLMIRSTLIKLLLGCVILAALIAVIAILAGSFGEVAWRAVGTVFSAIIHIGILFAVLSMTASGDERMERSTNLVINAGMVIAIASFFTSIFGVWGVLEGEFAAKLYVTYAVLLFVILHAKTLMDVQAVYPKVMPYVYANYVFMAIVAVLILGVVYVPDGFMLLSGFYGRALAASAIIDVTLGIVIAVMHRLYIQNHPELQKKSTIKNGGSGLRIIGALLLFFFVILPLLRFAL